MGRDRKTSVLQWSTFQYVGYSSSSNSYFIESEIGRLWLFIDALKARRDTQCIARLNLIKALGLNKNDRTFKVSINVRKSKVLNAKWYLVQACTNIDQRDIISCLCPPLMVKFIGQDVGVSPTLIVEYPANNLETFLLLLHPKVMVTW